jgi:cytochrome c-type biogenesis protein CcmF
MLGSLFLILALIFLVISALSYLRLASGNTGSLKWARFSYYLLAIFVTLASVYLFSLFLTDRFEYGYVGGYSSTDLSLLFKASAFWAGQEGTFLLWLWFASLLGFWVMRRAKSREGWVMFFYLLCQLFLFVMIFVKSPFVKLTFTPTAGRGLNPLLENFWMVIHPPIVFVGYAALAIPFSFALSCLVTNEYEGWIKITFPWVTFSALTLGVGIFIGGYWAYETLGWGGYWGWDPVENASLIPWVFNLALLHGMLIESSKGSLRKTNLFLAIVCFLFVLYGTFLTRSGVLADFSVHSFGDLGINNYLILFIGLFALFSLGLLIYRFRGITAPIFSKRLLSQQFAVFLALLFFCLSALLILLGTSAPILTRIFGQAAAVQVDYYINTHLPIAIVLGLLLAFCPLLAWSQTPFSEIARSILPPLIAALLLTVAGFFLQVRETKLVLLLFTSLLAAFVNLQVLVFRLRQGWVKLGGYLAHFGLAIMLIGILASSGYNSSERIAIPEGKTESALGHELTFQRVRELSAKKAEVWIGVKKGVEEFIARPLFILGDQGLVRTPFIKKYLFSDFYISPEQISTNQGEEGEGLVLGKGEEKELGGYLMKFIDFDLSFHGNAEERGVGATLEVSKQKMKARLTPAVLYDSQGRRIPKPAELPGGSGFIYLEQVRADLGQVQIRLGSAEEILFLEVSRKPLINFVWLGVILISVGMLLATRRRFSTPGGREKPQPPPTAQSAGIH